MSLLSRTAFKATLEPSGNGPAVTEANVLAFSQQLRVWGSRSVLSLADQGISAAAGFGLNLVLARWMPADEYGAFAVAFTVFLFISGFHNVLLLEPLSVFGPSRHVHQWQAYFRSQVMVHGIIAGAASAILLTSGLIAHKLHPEAPLARALIGIALALPLLLLFWLVRRMWYVRGLPQAALPGSGLYLVLVLAGAVLLRRSLALSSFNVFLWSGAASLVSSAVLLGRLGLYRGAERSLPALSWGDVLLENWRYGRWLMGSTILFSAGNQIQMMIVAGMLGLGVAGVLRAMQIPSLVMTQVVTAAGLLVLPTLSHDYGRSRVLHLRDKAIVVSLVLGMSALVFAGALAFFAKPLERLLFDGRYAGDAQWMAVLALIPAMNGFAMGFSAALRASQRPHFDLLCNFAAAPVGLGSAALFTNWWGIGGAAESMVLASATLAVAAYVCFQYSARKHSAQEASGRRRAENAVAQPPSEVLSTSNKGIHIAKPLQDGPLGSAQPHSLRERPNIVRASTAFFTNCIPPYWLPTIKALARSLPSFRIFLSTAMEADRDWKPDFGDLPVRIQKCWTYASQTNFVNGTSLRGWRHIPYDTLPFLFRHRPDVVISAQLGYRSAQAAIYRMLFRKSRLVIWATLSLHTERGVPRWRQIQRRLLLRWADAVLTNGTSGFVYLRSLGVPRGKIVFLPYCAEISLQLATPLKRDPRAARRLLFTGRLVELKGLVPFLRVLSDWTDNHPGFDCEFWIAGDGPQRLQLERLPLSPQIKLRFLGSVAYEKLAELYCQAGILVFPTFGDEWGVVVNEALASGLPVLGSLYSQAVLELIEDGVNGWTFLPDQYENMYAALDRAMTAPAGTLDLMRRACRQSVRHLTAEHGAECFLEAVRFVRGMD
ncbi:MAG TPA: glycosyltransferase [Candidatus Acidoferrum sp.]|nr:glycosyltransferase [Candidatus Acidoferrum sp.]